MAGPSPHSQLWRWEVQRALDNETTPSGGPPPNPLPGSYWFDNTTGKLFVWYQDVNSAQWVEVPPGTGVAGPTGPTGSTGATGPANTLAIGTVTTVTPGGAATSTITGTAPSQTLNLGIPSGLTGPANSLAIGTVTTVAPGGAATSSITGAAPSQTLNLGIPRGDVGAQGPAGPANSLAIGTVTTVAPGGAATSSITGAAPSQTLNLGIPRGDVGAQGLTGNTGSQGTQGIQGVAGPPNSLAIGTVTTVTPGGAATSTITGTAPSQTLNLGIPRGDQGIQGPIGPAGGATAQTRNRIVNSAMQISQENSNTAGTAMGYFPADQFSFSGVSSATFSIQRIQSTTPNGSVNRIRTTVNVADASLAATEYHGFITTVEGSRMSDFRYGTASAKQSILRFGFKAPAGTYSISVRNTGAARSYVANFVIAAGQANIDTEQIFIIPGDVTGTWLIDTGRGIELYVTIGTGTTYQGTLGWNAGNILGTSSNTNGVATAGAVFELFDVGLYLDPYNTGFPPNWEMPNEIDELRACQRYYYKTTAAVYTMLGYFYATAAAASMGAGVVIFPAPMRIAPTMATLIAPTLTNCSALAWTGDENAFAARVTVTAAGSYRAWAGQYGFSARL